MNRFAFYDQELILGMKKEDAHRFKAVARETMNLVGPDVPTRYVRSVTFWKIYATALLFCFLCKE